ncbi:MAG: mannose-6-phosphate isomerase, partial [Enterococcus sp.]
DYTLVTVIEGYGNLIVGGQSYEMKAGTSCILPAEITEWKVEGEMKIIASTPGTK